MEFRIAQTQKYRGNDYWDWSVWIVAAAAKLREIDHVIWILHPSFSPSRVERKSPETGFRLDTSGWGSFRLHAELHTRDGEIHRVSRVLELTYPDLEEAATSSEALTPGAEDTAADALSPYVFMSYSSEDAGHAGAVRETMKRYGVRVRDASEIKPGLPFDAAIRKMIRESAGVMSVVGSDYASPYVIAEMKLAESEEKPTIALLPEGVDRPIGFSPNIREMRFGRENGAMETVLANFADTLGSGKVTF